MESDLEEVHDHAAEENPQNLAELPAPCEEYVVETGTVRRICDWGTLVVPVDEFEVDQSVEDSVYGKAEEEITSIEWYT